MAAFDAAPRVAPPETPRRRRYAPLVLAVVVQVVVLYAPDTGGAPILPGLDLLVHGFVFAAVVLTGRHAGVPGRLLVPALLAHAPLSELVQARLLSGRDGSVADVLADVAGTLVAATVVGLAHRRRRGIMGS